MTKPKLDKYAFINYNTRLGGSYWYIERFVFSFATSFMMVMKYD